MSTSATFLPKVFLAKMGRTREDAPRARDGLGVERAG